MQINFQKVIDLSYTVDENSHVSCRLTLLKFTIQQQSTRMATLKAEWIYLDIAPHILMYLV